MNELFGLNFMVCDRQARLNELNFPALNNFNIAFLKLVLSLAIWINPVQKESFFYLEKHWNWAMQKHFLLQCIFQCSVHFHSPATRFFSNPCKLKMFFSEFIIPSTSDSHWSYFIYFVKENLDDSNTQC